MENQILISAEFSADEVREKVRSKNKNSLIGTIMPLAIPAIYILYMMVEEVKLSRLDSFSKFLIVGCLAASAVFFFLHQKYTQSNEAVIKEADEAASKQSLIMTEAHIYGNTLKGSFSIEISDAAKIYTSYIEGGYPELTVKLNNGNTLTFKYIKNYADIISCFNSLKTKVTHTQAPIDEQTQETAALPQPAPEPEQYDVIITSGHPTISQLKALRAVTGLELAEAKAVLSALPYTVARSLSENQARYMKIDLVTAGMQVELKKR